MTAKRKQPRGDVAPRFQIVTLNKLSNLKLGDRVAYRDPIGRERVGTVSRLDLARNVVMAHVRGEIRDQRITVRNFVRIEARTARNIIDTNRDED